MKIFFKIVACIRAMNYPIWWHSHLSSLFLYSNSPSFLSKQSPQVVTIYPWCWLKVNDLRQGWREMSAMVVGLVLECWMHGTLPLTLLQNKIITATIHTKNTHISGQYASEQLDGEEFLSVSHTRSSLRSIIRLDKSLNCSQRHSISSFIEWGYSLLTLHKRIWLGVNWLVWKTGSLLPLVNCKFQITKSNLRPENSWHLVLFCEHIYLPITLKYKW